jgi:hypothetical protein
MHIAQQLEAICERSNEVASCRWGYFATNPATPVVRTELTHRDYVKPLEWLVESLTHDEGMMGGWMWLIPRSLWDKTGGFDERLSLNNDFQFSVKLLLASTGVRFASGAVYSYRKGIAYALSGRSGRAAMDSAYLTTRLGTELLLAREDSPRIRRLCANRFQHWLFRFYPEYPDLVAQTEQRIRELGGSELRMRGGLLTKLLGPVVGWKGVRQTQRIAYRVGWRWVLKRKAEVRIRRLQAGKNGSTT